MAGHQPRGAGRGDGQARHQAPNPSAIWPQCVREVLVAERVGVVLHAVLSAKA